MDPLTIKLLARLFSPEMDNLLQQSPSRGFNKLCRNLAGVRFNLYFNLGQFSPSSPIQSI